MLKVCTWEDGRFSINICMVSNTTEGVLADGGEVGVGGETDEDKVGGGGEREEGDKVGGGGEREEGDEGEGEREGEGEGEGDDPHRARRRPHRKWVCPEEYQQNL